MPPVTGYSIFESSSPLHHNPDINRLIWPISANPQYHRANYSMHGIYDAMSDKQLFRGPAGIHCRVTRHFKLEHMIPYLDCAAVRMSAAPERLLGMTEAWE